MDMELVTLAKRIGALIALMCTLIINIGQGERRPGYCEPVSMQTFYLTEALLRGQGVTNDGEHYIFSSNYGLTKTELDGMTVVKSDVVSIPQELLDLGCKHIGGISCANGVIYAPIEDSKVFQNLYIAKYDSDTLECLGYTALPLDKHARGVPWCVADAENGVVYSARCENIEELNVYDIDTLAFIKTIPVTKSIDNIQGGEMHDGVLYVSVSHELQSVYAINVATGEVQVAFDRNLIEGCEGEGMTILPTEDGALFHVLDISDVRIAVNFRHYDFDPASIEWELS
ncbi:MAG: glutaminyl-peptide cyclotransferase [Clostridiales bacterium]|nr:glutaminyl-peptide cyclotransferase [Clostridiales bacterium]